MSDEANAGQGLDAGTEHIVLTPGMWRQLDIVRGQRMCKIGDKWFVWRRIDRPPYTDGAELFRWWKPRHLLAAVAQVRWAKRSSRAWATAALTVVFVLGVESTVMFGALRSLAMWMCAIVCVLALRGRQGNGRWKRTR